MRFSLAIVSVLLLGCYSAQGLRCFTCNGASSNEECNLKGRIVQCQSNEGSCQNEVRLSEGRYYSITKRCKQTAACSNNQEQNQKPAWIPTQCNPAFTNNSVCRCCCTENECNARAMPCDKDPKCPAPVQPRNGKVTCDNMNFGNSTCTYQCDQGYNLVGDKDVKCVEDGFGLRWESETPKCERPTCGISIPRSPPNGKVSCSNSNKRGSVCAFTCDLGFEIVGNFRTICNSNQKWSNSVPLCNRITCDSASTIFLTNGEVSCTDFNFYTSQCSYKCNQGFRLIGSSTSNCEPDGSWTSAKPECQQIACDVQKTALISNGQTICSDNNEYASVCTYTCQSGYYRTGIESITCQEDGLWSDSEAQCQPITCDENAPEITNGNVACSNNNFYESTCLFACDEGFKMINAGNMICQDNFEWSKTSPVCEQIVCSPPHDSLDNGFVECNNNEVYGSICTYFCNPGFELVGIPTASCGEDGFWSNPPPSCQQLTCSTNQSPPINGQVDCSSGNLAFSDCLYSCGDGSERWELHGSNSTSCEFDTVTQSFEWTATEAPCCARRCPPYAQVDLFLVLDSSSSVGKENWNKTVHFMKDIIDNFVISPNDMLVAAVRYNKFIDTDSEIMIGQYTDLDSTTNAIVNMPYDGSGTLTGNALYYVLRNMLTAPGNRPDVQDLVLVVTDGISKDDVATPATMLRATGTNVVALGIVNQKGSLKKEDIIDIANDPEKTVLLDTGFEGLSTDLVDVILKQVCGNPCERQNQYSGIAF
ncbi:E-selectin-like [Ciona intestinalis]